MRWTVFCLLCVSVLGAALAGDFCTDSLGDEIYCSGYCCGDDCCYYDDDSLGVGYIVLIVALVLIKICFWTCFCFYRRRRIANGVVIRQNVQPQCVVSSVSSSSYNYGYDQRGPQQLGVPPPYSPSPNTSQVPMKSHA